MNASTQVSEPEILTAKTYFYSPGRDSGARRRNEEKRRRQVADFFRAIGMQVSLEGGDVVGNLEEICAVFSYSESCHNVYKHLRITRNGTISNITSLRKLYSK